MRTFIVLFAVLVLGLATAQTSMAVLQVGDLAPDFTLEDVNHDAYSLSDFNGQVVVINFWQSS